MAEVLAFVGLASNVLNFIEVGAKLAHKYKRAYEISRGRGRFAFTELEADIDEAEASSRLLALPPTTEQPPNGEPSTESEKQLRAYHTECRAAAKRLVDALADLRGENMRTWGWRAFREIFATLDKKQKAIEQLKERLERLHRPILLCMGAVLRDQQSTMNRSMSQLVAENASLRLETVQGLDNIRFEIRELLDQVPISDTVADGKMTSPRNLVDINNYVSARLGPLIESLRDGTESTRRQLPILNSLHFEAVHTRYLSIKKTHSNTFEWLLQPSEHTFSHWLRSGSGVYWVRGKAGSGKSTLMCFLAEHTATKAYLEEWAGDSDLVIASHYFWNAGSSMQKSRVGLLRTLLLQIFKQCPDLIRCLCPGRWESAPDAAIQPWTEEELLSVLETLPTQCDLSAKFCFFIDGLDEYTDGARRYHGSYNELIDPIKRLAESPSIKICVSSRPWTPFEKAFGSGENKLQLEKLTHRDIEKFVRERLGNNEEFRALTQRDHRLNSFIDSIVTRAQGVFLWVHLVVNSLLNGISAEDDFDDLQARLDELPTDLEEYYRRILETIEPVYWEQTMRTLLIAMEANKALPILAYEFLDYERSDPGYALSLSPESISQLDMDQVARKMRKRLNARCKDVLEVTEDLDAHLLNRYKVDFLHRTARDFLEDTDVIAATMEKKGDFEFDSVLSMARVMLSLVKAFLAPEKPSADVLLSVNFVEDFMSRARKMEARITQTPEAAVRELPADSPVNDMFRLLDELDRVATETTPNPLKHYLKRFSDDSIPVYSNIQVTMLPYAVHESLPMYVATKLVGDDRRQIRENGGPLLVVALKMVMGRLTLSLNPNALREHSMVELLLRIGADPNQRTNMHDNCTPWLDVLVALEGIDPHSLPSASGEGHKYVSMTAYKVLRVMLVYGAEIESETAKKRLETILGRGLLSGGEVAELRKIMSERQQIMEEQQQSYQPRKRWFGWW